jgi:acyl carrier protein
MSNDDYLNANFDFGSTASEIKINLPDNQPDLGIPFLKTASYKELYKQYGTSIPAEIFIKTYLSFEHNLTDSELKDDASLKFDLGLDSLDVLVMLMCCDVFFQRKPADNNDLSINPTIGDVVCYYNNKYAVEICC